MLKNCSLLSCIFTSLALSLLSTTQACDFSRDVFSGGNDDKPDYGIYWFDSENNCKKAEMNQSDRFYDPSKKVVIFIHGWQNNSTEEQRRRTFIYDDAGGEVGALSQYWRNRGYNAGVLYWNQFADESDVQDAEAKIWSVDGPQGVRWRYLKEDGSVDYKGNINETVSELLVQNYIEALSNFKGSEIRLAGHSLGNQLAIVMTKILYDTNVPQAIKPQRLALLDPFYSNGSKYYLNQEWTGALAREYVSELRNEGVVFEAYRSSALTTTVFAGDANIGLLNMTAFTEIRPRYFSQFEQLRKHNSAMWHYFWSMGFTAPSINFSDDQGLSARTSRKRVEALMWGEQRLVHDSGVRTKTPRDDSYRYDSRL